MPRNPNRPRTDRKIRLVEQLGGELPIPEQTALMGGKPSKTGICGAKTAKGTPCRLPAGYGTDHVGYGTCKRHFGCTPSMGKVAAKQELAEVVEGLQLAGKVSRDVSPESVLLEEIARGAGAVAFFDDLVSKIDGNDILYPRAAILIDMWNEQRKILASVSTAVVKAGLTERLVRVVEGQAEILVKILLTVIQSQELALTPEQTVVARGLMAQQLRQVAIEATAS